MTDPARGAYDPDWVDLRGDDLAGVDLQPAELKAFVLANREALLAEAPILTARLRFPRGWPRPSGQPVLKLAV